MKNYIMLVALFMTVTGLALADATWESYIIRGDAEITENVTAPDSTTGWTLFDVSTGGEKAGWGTNYANGYTIGDIQSLSITRYVPETGDTNYAPYFNIWVVDSAGNYAVLANEPSHTSEYTSNGETAFDMTWDGSLSSATVWVYEVDGSAGFILPNGTTTNTNLGAGTANPFTAGDFADYTIMIPTSVWGGSGAPDDLNASTYTTYGFNWIFGDTQSNYVGGHLTQDPTIVLVPEPATMALVALGGILLRRRK